MDKISVIVVADLAHVIAGVLWHNVAYFQIKSVHQSESRISYYHEVGGRNDGTASAP